MGARPLFSCAHAWWSWDHPEIVRAVRGAWLQHLLPLVLRTIEGNAAAGRSPAKMEALCRQDVIRRNPRNFDRVLAGQYECSDGFRLALATALKIPASDLFPTNERWIECSTLRLCAKRIAAGDAQVYAAFRAGDSNGHAELADADLPKAARSAIERVIDCLEPKLILIDRVLQSRG